MAPANPPVTELHLRGACTWVSRTDSGGDGGGRDGSKGGGREGIIALTSVLPSESTPELVLLVDKLPATAAPAAAIHGSLSVYLC